MAQDDWNRRWKEIGPERRRRILRAVQRGEAVNDVRDAAFALELIDRRRRLAARFGRSRRWFSLRHVLILAVAGVPLGIVRHDFVIVGITVALTLYLMGLLAVLNKLEARANLAREKNEQLARLI